MYTWVYMCNDPSKLQLTLRALPKEPLQELNLMWVVTDEKNKHMHQDMLRAIEWFPCHVTISSDEHLINYAYRQLPVHPPMALRDYVDNPKPGWALGIKLLTPLFIKGPVLFTDDDVLVLKDPIELIRAGSFGTGQHTNSYNPDSTNTYRELTAFWDAIGAPGEADAYEYNDGSMDAGIWYVDGNRQDYAEKLCDFFACPLLDTFARHMGKFRTLDQRFLTLYGLIHHWRSLRTSKERIIFVQRFDAIPESAYKHVTNRDSFFVHYCASSHKSQYQKRLWRCFDD